MTADPNELKKVRGRAISIGVIYFVISVGLVVGSLENLYEDLFSLFVGVLGGGYFFGFLVFWYKKRSEAVGFIGAKALCLGGGVFCFLWSLGMFFEAYPIFGASMTVIATSLIVFFASSFPFLWLYRACLEVFDRA